MSTPDHYLVLPARDPAGDVHYALLPLDDSTIAKLGALKQALDDLQQHSPHLAIEALTTRAIAVQFVTSTQALRDWRNLDRDNPDAFSAHEALEQLLHEDPATISAEHVPEPLHDPTEMPTTSLSTYGDLTFATYWGTEGDDITAFTDLRTVERETRTLTTS